MNEKITSRSHSKENVNHPSHYSPGIYETINVIREWGLGFSLGNAVKYISRAGKKDKDRYIEDLEKAIWYIREEVEYEKKRKNHRTQDTNIIGDS